MAKKRIVLFSIPLVAILLAYIAFRHVAVTQVYRRLHENPQRFPVQLSRVTPVQDEQTTRFRLRSFLSEIYWEYGICVGLNVVEILEPGDEKHYFNENMQLIVDGIPQFEGLTTASTLDEPVAIYDVNGDPVAYGPIEYTKCWYPLLMPGRTHHAEVIVTTTSGVQHRYRWAFTTRH